MKVKLNSPVWHDKEERKAGEVLDVDQKTAARLVKIGVAQMVDAAASAPVEDGVQEHGIEEHEGQQNFRAMKLDELRAECNAFGIPYEDRETKAELIAKLEAEQD